MERNPQSSFRSRLAKGQGGNIIIMVAGFMIVWFLFFTIKDWIKETKDARYQREQKEVVHYYPNDIYHNPYQ